MTSARVKSRTLVPAAGVFAAVATAVSGWAPIAQAAPSILGAKDGAQRAEAGDAVDGTYESCGAYFGFGKNEFGVLDVVDFDVADQDGADGASHAVPADTQVVLELTNEDGDVLECTPEEVSEADWDAAMGDIELYMPDGKTLPAWPGPGHYAYPSVVFEPYIDDFGTVVDVGFKVTSVPDGHTLVSPTDVHPLDVHYLDEKFPPVSFTPDPRVQALIEADAGADASAAFAEALGLCDSDEPVDYTEDLVAAVNALNAYRGFDPQEAEDIGCYTLGTLSYEVSFLLGLVETTTYTEPIVLALPEDTTTTSTTPTTTTPPAVSAAVAAGAVPGSPTYTG
ncbi:hypothetical protein BH10ACT1_BH10ACT1_26180 [soil metagenome]